jgi:hypothetical protein
MKMKHLIFLFIIPLYCLGEAVNIINHDYTMVDLRNRLTTKLLAAGPTSITLSVEWPLDIEIEQENLDLMAKLDIEQRGWSHLTSMWVDPTEGKAIREILYEDTSWHYFKETTNFEKKVWLAVRVPAFYPPDPDTLMSIGAGGKYEEDDEEDWDEDNMRKSIAEFLAESDAQIQVTDRPKAQEERGEEKEGSVAQDNHLWLYLIVLPCVCAVIYFVWRKLNATN